MFEKLIEKYENRIDVLRGDEAEIDEMYEDYNPSDWSGGNFDDAYEIGLEHGRVFEEIERLTEFIAELKDIAKGAR